MKKLNRNDVAPAFELQDGDGKTWKLEDLKGQKTILYFYPADDTPGCTTQACDFRDSQHELIEAGYQILGISPQDAGSHQSFAQKYSLTFPLLVDEDHKVAEAYGTWGEKNNYGKKYMGIIRSTFVIGADGRLEKAMYNVRAKGHVAKLKAELFSEK